MMEIDSRKLPLMIKIKGEHGNYVQFILKGAGRKLGAQLIKLDQSMLQLVGQN